MSSLSSLSSLSPAARLHPGPQASLSSSPGWRFPVPGDDLSPLHVSGMAPALDIARLEQAFVRALCVEGA